MNVRPMQALFLLVMLQACYAFDSATSACRQNPAYCASVAGEETVVPARGSAELASVAGAVWVFNADAQYGIEHDLEECARLADMEVNRMHFGEDLPSREKCQALIPKKDPCGRSMTWAMQLGVEKHQLAFQCTHDRLDARIPGHFSLEPRYRYNRQTGEKQLLGSAERRALLQKGCGDELVGTIVPDVVIHPGDPLKVLAVYDFKFPCPISNEPRWNEHHKGHLYQGLSQGDIYSKAFDVTPHLVSPARGVE